MKPASQLTAGTTLAAMPGPAHSLGQQRPQTLPQLVRLCGGTHVMRRLEAAVGVEGFGHLARERDLVARIAEQLQAPRAELPDRIATLLDRLKTADRENQRLRQQAVQAQAAGLAARAVAVNGTLVATATAERGADAARSLATAVRDLLPAGKPGVVAVGAAAGGAPFVVGGRLVELLL